jgi:hypothetical protein
MTLKKQENTVDMNSGNMNNVIINTVNMNSGSKFFILHSSFFI